MPFRFPLDSAFAEFIFAPFHDPEHAPAIADRIDTDSAAGISRQHDWCWTTLRWTDADPARSAFTYRFLAPFNVRHHDTLIVALSLPAGAQVEVALMVRGYQRVSPWVGAFSGKGHRQELRIPLARMFPAPRALIGARNFSGLALRVRTASAGPGVLTLSWAALRASTVWRYMSDLRKAQLPDWSPWVLPESAWGERSFDRELLFDASALADVRAKKQRSGWREHFALLESRARDYLKRNPEDDWGEYLPNRDIRYLRESEQGRSGYHWESLIVAFVGLVNEDSVMIRHAVRYLMCMVHTRYWADSAEHRIPSSTWNQRAFMEEMTTTSVALLADWLSFALTAQAKSLIRNALWEKGIAPVRRDLMLYDYMHRMNQGAVFCRAPILGGLYLEGSWPRARGFVDEAYTWMNAVLDRYLRADGSVHEGVGYLCQTLTACLWSIIAYCRARQIDWRDVVAKRFGVVERYVRVMSASLPGRIIPAGDCRTEWLSGDAVPILASVFPDGAFADVLSSCLCSGSVHELTGTLTRSGGLIGMVYGPAECRASRSIVAASDLLPESGKASFSGESNGLAVRFWASSSSTSATHAHRDHGQFLLEVNGTPVFVDRGMVEYWFTDAHFLSRSWLHNVLTPVGIDGSFADQVFADTDAPMRSDIVRGRGSADVPSNGVWGEAMTSYGRRFEVDLPSTVHVLDSGSLKEASRVAFHLHSLHSFAIDGNRATLLLDGVRIVIEFPWATEVSCRQQLADLLWRPVHHLWAVSEPQRDFSVRTTIRCELVASGSHPGSSLAR